MNKRIVMFMALALGLMGAASATQAGQWYEAKSCWSGCTDTTQCYNGMCEDANCKPQESPAQIVEDNDGLVGTGNRITDGPNGEVKVYVPYMMGRTYFLFRTEKACEAFISAEVQRFRTEEEKRSKVNRELEKKYN